MDLILKLIVLVMGLIGLVILLLIIIDLIKKKRWVWLFIMWFAIFMFVVNIINNYQSNISKASAEQYHDLFKKQYQTIPEQSKEYTPSIKELPPEKW